VLISITLQIGKRTSQKTGGRQHLEYVVVSQKRVIYIRTIYTDWIREQR